MKRVQLYCDDATRSLSLILTVPFNLQLMVKFYLKKKRKLRKRKRNADIRIIYIKNHAN